MKIRILSVFILVAPILTVILVNELVRRRSTESPYRIGSITVVNSNLQMKSKCSWSCHNDTGYCKNHHVKLVRHYFRYSDVLFFGVIDLLKSTGNYGLANIVFLVFLLPMIMFYLLIRSIDLQMKIRNLKSQRDG